MMSKNFHVAKDYIYSLRYHLVWRPRFNIDVLKNGKNIIEKTLKGVCRQYGYEVLYVDIKQDYIHLFLSTGPTVAPADAVRVLKSVTAAFLLKYFPQLKVFYGLYGSLWEKDCLLSTTFQLETETIRKYTTQKKGR